MSQYLSPTQVGLSVGALFLNYFYHHKKEIRVMLDMDPMPEFPTIKSDPPTYTFDPTFEENIDKKTKEIEEYTEKKPSVPIGDQLEYKGDYTKKNKKDTQIYPNGKGVYYAKSNPFKMVGQFTDGVVNGPALFRYPDGTVVKTDFKNGEINGLGVRYLEDMKFEGHLVDGKPQGSGVYTFDGNRKIFVKEEDGVEKAKCYDGDGRLWYRGEFKEGQCHGYGEFFYRNGHRYIGDFNNGKMEGVGVMKNMYGDVIYNGVFSNDHYGNKWKVYTEPGIIAATVILNMASMLYKR